MEEVGRHFRSLSLSLSLSLSSFRWCIFDVFYLLMTPTSWIDSAGRISRAFHNPISNEPIKGRRERMRSSYQPIGVNQSMKSWLTSAPSVS